MLGVDETRRRVARGAAVDLAHELFLRADVLVDEPEVHARVFGDVAQGDVGPPLGDQGAGGVEQRRHHLRPPPGSNGLRGRRGHRYILVT